MQNEKETTRVHGAYSIVSEYTRGVSDEVMRELSSRYLITSRPPIYGLSASGITTLPSSC